MEPQLQPSHQLFHSFCIRPDMKFQTQTADEVVILVLRQHPIVALSWIFNSLLFLLLIVFVNFLFSNVLSSSQTSFIYLVAFMFIFSYLLFFIVTYHFNVGIVTNRRVLDVNLHLFGYREMIVANLSHIEDITGDSSGFLQSLLNYGDVFVQTAGTKENIEFERVPKPNEVIDIINKLITT